MNQLPPEKYWTNESIKAWRMFATPGMNSISSITMRSVWWSREMPAAQCVTEWAQAYNGIEGHHQTPSPGCTCGYWSIKPELLTHPPLWGEVAWDPIAIIKHGALGWVEQWGELVEYEHGYRSSHIKVTAFIDFEFDTSMDRHLTHVLDDRGLVGFEYVAKEQQKVLLHDYRSRLHALASRFDVPVVMADG